MVRLASVPAFQVCSALQILKTLRSEPLGLPIQELTRPKQGLHQFGFPFLVMNHFQVGRLPGCLVLLPPRPEDPEANIIMLATGERPANPKRVRRLTQRKLHNAVFLEFKVRPESPDLPCRKASRASVWFPYQLKGGPPCSETTIV